MGICKGFDSKDPLLGWRFIPIKVQGGFEDNNDHTTLKPTKSRNWMRIEKANTFLLSTQYRLELEGKLFRNH